jgi:hypothetical protein
LSERFATFHLEVGSADAGNVSRNPHMDSSSATAASSWATISPCRAADLPASRLPRFQTADKYEVLINLHDAL